MDLEKQRALTRFASWLAGLRPGEAAPSPPFSHAPPFLKPQGLTAREALQLFLKRFPEYVNQESSLLADAKKRGTIEVSQRKWETEKRKLGQEP